MVRRGFTLIEVLAVIAILVVLTAIGLPVVESRLAEARFDATVSRVDAGMAWARAESQRRGEPLRVEARPSEGGMGLFLALLEPAMEGAGRSGAGGAGEEPGATPQPFAVVERGLVVSDRDPRRSLSEEEVGGSSASKTEKSASTARSSDAAADAEQPLVIATFLPDGSAMAAGPFYVTGLGRAASLTVNHWTGGVQVRLLHLAAITAKGGEPEARLPDEAAEKER